MSAMYVVQSYSAGKKGVRPDTPVLVNSVLHARRMAERLAVRKAMVIAFMRVGDGITGEFEDPKLIAAFGDDLPDEINEMEKLEGAGS